MTKSVSHDLQESLRAEITKRTRGPGSITIAQLSRATGVSQNVLHKLRRNETKSTEASNAVALFRFSGWSTDTIDGFSEGGAVFSSAEPNKSEAAPAAANATGGETGRHDVNDFEINSHHRQGADTVTIKAVLNRSGIDIFIARLREIQRNMSG